MDTSRPRRSEFRGVGGIRLVADEYGEQLAPPAVLLHGGGQTRRAWGATAQVLAERGWRTIALDLRGHGDSGWDPEGGYDFMDFAGDVHAVIESLPAPPVMVGASLGGIATLAAQATSSRQLYAAVVLVDVTPRLELAGLERLIGFMTAHPDGFGSLTEAADAIAAYLPHRVRPTEPGGLERTLRRCDDGRWRWRWDTRFLTSNRDLVSGDPVAVSRRVDELRVALTAAARRLQVPTLLVRGALSDVVSQQGAQELLDAVPQARHVDVPGAAHMVAGDRNDAFTAAVVGFLEQLRIVPARMRQRRATMPHDAGECGDHQLPVSRRD